MHGLQHALLKDHITPAIQASYRLLSEPVITEEGSQAKPAGGVVSANVHDVLEAWLRPVNSAWLRVEMLAVCAVVVVTGTVVQLPPMAALVRLCGSRKRGTQIALESVASDMMHGFGNTALDILTARRLHAGVQRMLNKKSHALTE
jgi:hypothetical protein